MAELYKLDQSWDDWIATRPKEIQEMARKYPANRLYRLTTTGQRVVIQAYTEGGTVRVAVSGEFNLIPFNTSVFGIDPAELVECSLPLPSEPVGELLKTQAEIDAYITEKRAFIQANRGH